MPVYQDAVVFLGTAITLGFAIVVLASWWVLWRRDLHRRLAAVAVLVSADRQGGKGLDETITRLEVAARGGPPTGRMAPVAVATDRASDRESEPSARETELQAERLRLALGELPVGIVVCDDGGRVVFRNPAAADQLWPRSARTDPELAEAMGEVLDEALGGRRLSRPIELAGPPRRAYRLTGLALDSGSRRVGAVVVVEDFSDELRDTTSRYDILADLGRELTEPVVAMSVLADGLATEEDPTIRRRLADRTRSESTRARRMVEDLIELGRLSSQETGTAESVRMLPVIVRAVSGVSPQAQLRLVEVRITDVPGDLAAFGERRQVELAVTKLVEHAVETARAGARLEVRARAADGAVGTSSPPRPALEVEISDPCPSSAATRSAGLALAIVEQTARNLGGSTLAVSTAEGSTALLRLPAAPRLGAVEPAPVAGATEPQDGVADAPGPSKVSATAA